MQRGKINNRRRALQIKDFGGLRWGNITPTDFDLFIDYKDRCFVIGELKYKDTAVPFGQLLALERACDNMQKPTIAFIASHSDEGDIAVADARPVSVHWHRRWVTPKSETVRELIDRFLKTYGQADEW